MHTPKISGRTAVIVGSTSGIGEAIAREFAANGAHVFVSGRRRERGGAVVDKIRSAGGIAEFIQTDASVPDELRWLLDSAVERTGRLDILVNNAATELTKPLVNCTTADFEHIMNVNLRSYFVASVHAVKIMLRTPTRGTILNINSVASERPVPGTGLYSMSKGAVRQLTKSLALEHAADGIRVNEIRPGMVQTEIFLAPEAQDVARMGIAATPLGRIGQPDEIAKAALHLVSDEAGFTTGSSLLIDGGLTI